MLLTVVEVLVPALIAAMSEPPEVVPIFRSNSVAPVTAVQVNVSMLAVNVDPGVGVRMSAMPDSWYTYACARSTPLMRDHNVTYSGAPFVGRFATVVERFIPALMFAILWVPGDVPTYNV